MSPSQRFERLIEHLHLLSESEAVDVSWNQHIPDPDNLAQQRQIDILVRRGDHVTHVECRLRKEKQDVGWIEELIGRRASLKADCIIAVSDSGFTEGAMRKADSHGIILRDLQGLSEEEVLKWGERLTLRVKWLHFGSMSLCFSIPSAYSGTVSIDQIADAFSASGKLYSILDAIKGALPHERLEQGDTLSASVRLRTDLAIGLCRIVQVEAVLRAWLTEETISFYSVDAYGPPGQPTCERRVSIGDASRLGIRIARCGDECSLLIDMSKVEPPANAMLYHYSMRSDTPVTLKYLQCFTLPLPTLLLEKKNFCMRPDDDAGA